MLITNNGKGCGMTKFKIFYSWQSDLPGSKTRYFIRECIDEAIKDAGKSEAIDAVRDEATKGLTGSPDIITSIYSKIDECDMVIADVSLCFKRDVTKDGQEKYSPNPNVMLELGYAVKTLSWERVLCISNTDFGSDYPFDIDHNRQTSFSLDGKDKKAVRRRLAKKISEDIQTLQGQLPRAKAGFSSHIIGSYDFNQQKVIPLLVPFDFRNSESFKLKNEDLLTNARKLLAEIQVITESMNLNNDEKEKAETLSFWSDKEKYRECIKRSLDIDVDDSFFCLGDLKLSTQSQGFCANTNNVTEDENNKYDKLFELYRIISQYEIRTKYLNTFYGMEFIPLAIQNISSTTDSNISIIVKVDHGEYVDPSEQLIPSDLDGFQGYLCSYEDEPGVIIDLFLIEDDSGIQFEDKYYDPNLFSRRIPYVNGDKYAEPPKTAEDYKTELENFIASTNGRGFYRFSVQSLRPGECRWLSEGLLLKPIDGEITISYVIYSDHSNGKLEGILEFKPNTMEP